MVYIRDIFHAVFKSIQYKKHTHTHKSTNKNKNKSCPQELKSKSKNHETPP